MHPPKVTEDSMSCRVKRRMLGSNGSPVRWYVAAVYLEDISADVDLAPDAGMIRAHLILLSRPVDMVGSGYAAPTLSGLLTARTPPE